MTSDFDTKYLRHMLHSTKARAKRRGIEFALTLEDIRAIWPADDRCPILGHEFRRGYGSTSHRSPALARVLCSAGYVRDNVAIISARANNLRGRLDLERHEQRGNQAIANWLFEFMIR